MKMRKRSEMGAPLGWLWVDGRRRNKDSVQTAVNRRLDAKTDVSKGGKRK